MFLLTLMITARLVNAQANHLTADVIHRSQSRDVMDRSLALEELLRDPSAMRDPRVQEFLIKLLNTESTSNDWGALDEYAPYQRYYFSLMTAVELIAFHSHQQSAWDELVMVAHYGEDSEFAQKLAEHEEAIRVALRLALSRKEDEVARSRGLSFLSNALASCQNESTRKACPLINSKQDEIMKLLRAGSNDDSSIVQAKSLWGLGICGDLADANFLESLIKPDSDSSFIQLTRLSAKEIRSRASLEQKSGR